MVQLSRREFERLVLKALESLPTSIQERLDNLDVVIREWPTRADLEESGLKDRYELFGLYQGVPLIDRTHYDMALPDKITIFQRPIEAACDTKTAVVREVGVTVIHEVAHHFGINDATLEQTDYR